MVLGSNQSWQTESLRLQRLEDSYRFLPVGWGSEGKAPMLPEWSKHPGYQISQITSTPGVKALGVISHPLMCFDFDGESSESLARQHGLEYCQTWIVGRSTDPNRFKVLFKPTPEQLAQLPDGQLTHSQQTKSAERDIDGKVIKKAEALEVFCHPGRQVIVLGEHPSSGGHYYWREGHGPEALVAPPKSWWDYVLEVSADYPKQSKAKDSESSGAWIRLSECPVCCRGPNDNPICQLSGDGKVLRCFVGSTFHPPTGLKPGQYAGDTDWAFVREQDVGWGRHHIFKKDYNPVRVARRWFRAR
jgi:hypothetical protein